MVSNFVMRLKRVNVSIVAGMILYVSAAAAAPLLFNNDPANTCTDINCESAEWRGSILQLGTQQVPNIVPFTADIWSDANQCLRLDISEPTADVHLVLVSPKGRVWRSNDRDSSDNAPLIMVDPTPEQGYYTVMVSTPGDVTSDSIDFLFNYGLYMSGNANCTPPTPSALGPIDTPRGGGGPN
ncbi:MAG: hypothetical protein OEU26_07600 [Candidatus Tectomicrobia bacterium]|nr:hypothetical protein [Candidatus Tectomicrobia bacterium]